MKTIAVSHHQGRVSPVFDVADNLMLVGIGNGLRQQCDYHMLQHTDPFLRAREVARLGAEALLCGAISLPLEQALGTMGVRVIGFLCGPVDQVIDAFLKDGLTSPEFLMPGCCGRRRHCHGQRRRHGMQDG